MSNARIVSLTLSACVLAGLAGPALADHDLAVELWTDRGNGAIYEPGDDIELRTRTSDDAYLLVYEIDSEGYVRMLFPSAGSTGWVEGRITQRVPPRAAPYELAVQGPEGVGYLVAIASRRPFHSLPWYLRPYDTEVDPSDYEGERDEEQGVTREGRIVGDAFVAMERIRRRVVGEDVSYEEVASAYTQYNVGHRFRYPRYLCYDCHRPGYWAWWSDFDPYYTHCSVFRFRVNVGWWWGYPCWTNYVPYYVYVVRDDCPPFYRPYGRVRYSSWDGWGRWRQLWGDRVVRYKADRPAAYQPPVRGKDGRYVRTADRPTPPGFRDPSGGAPSTIGGVPVGRLTRPRDGGAGGEREGAGIRVTRKPGIERLPVGGSQEEGTPARGARDRGWRSPSPVGPPPGERGPSLRPPRDERPHPVSPPSGGSEARQGKERERERPRPQPAVKPDESPRQDPPRPELRPEPPRFDKSGGKGRAGKGKG